MIRRVSEYYERNFGKILWCVATAVLVWLDSEGQFRPGALGGFIVGALWAFIGMVIWSLTGLTEVDGKNITDRERADAEFYIRYMRDLKENESKKTLTEAISEKNEE